MKRPSGYPLLVCSALALALTAGCGRLGLPAGQGPAVSVRNLGTLVVRPVFAASNFRVQDVLPGQGYQSNEIASLTLTVRSNSGSVVATATLSGSAIYSLVTFSNLAIGTYVILCEAFDGQGTKISLDGNSVANVTVTESSVSTVDLQVQLADKSDVTQSAAFAGITVIAGNLVTSGPVTITTSPVFTTQTHNVVEAGTTPTGTLANGTYTLRVATVGFGPDFFTRWDLLAGEALIGFFEANYVSGATVTITSAQGTISFAARTTASPDELASLQDTLTVVGQN